MKVIVIDDNNNSQILNRILNEHNTALGGNGMDARVLSSTIKTYRQRFIVAKNEVYYKLAVNDIAYVCFDGCATRAFTFDKKTFVLNMSLDRLEEELDPKVFFRTNRQIIVNVDAVDRFEVYFKHRLVVKLVNGLHNKVLISRAKASSFKDWMNQ